MTFKQLLWRLIPHHHGTANMKHIETTPQVFGAYEIYKCTKCGKQEAL